MSHSGGIYEPSRRNSLVFLPCDTGLATSHVGRDDGLDRNGDDSLQQKLGIQLVEDRQPRIVVPDSSTMFRPPPPELGSRRPDGQKFAR